MAMNNGDIAHYERDARLISYLLACNNEIKFVGTTTNKQTVYFGFSPKTKVLHLINQYFLNQSPHIPAKKLFDAIDEFRVILHREKSNISL